MTLPILLGIVVSFVIAWPMTWWLRGVGHRFGGLDSGGAAGHLKPEIRRVPNIGGIAIFTAVAAPLTIGLIAAAVLDQPTVARWSPQLAEHLPGVRERAGMALTLLVALAALHVLGLIDDRRPLGPWVKLGTQVLVAAVVVFNPLEPEEHTRLLTLLDDVPGLEAVAPWPSMVLSIAWLVVVMNAINFMDNMDGLAGGVACIAASLFLVAALIGQQWFVAGMLALLIGSLLGFLYFNFPHGGLRSAARGLRDSQPQAARHKPQADHARATIFMGDGGSLVVGFLLGFLTIRTTYVIDPMTGAGDGSARWYAVFMPLIVLAVPLYDFISVVVIRLAQGRNPMVGDQQHFSHRLVQRGLSPRTMLLVVYGLTLATGLGGIYIGQLREGWQAALVGLQTLVILGVLGLYEHALFRPTRGRT